MTKTNSLSVAIIAKNEETKIEGCIKTVLWADEVVVIDNGSTDNTPNIAKKLGANVVSENKGTYREARERAIKEVKGKWIFYIDADERADNRVRDEVLTVIKSQDQYSAYVIPRRNIILGRELRHGGWWPDYAKRLFLKSKIIGWKGNLHEEPIFEGEFGYLKSPLIHLKHDNLSEMVAKTNNWSETEAKLMLEAGHPPMTIPRFATACLREFGLRFIKEKGFLDGVEGIIYSIYQIYSKFISYAKLWEFQKEVK